MRWGSWGLGSPGVRRLSPQDISEESSITKLYAVLDVPLEMTSAFVVDEKGDICLEAKVPSEPHALCDALSALDAVFVRVSRESRPAVAVAVLRPDRCGAPAESSRMVCPHTADSVVMANFEDSQNLRNCRR